jgi:hypothetical protein
MARDVMTVFVIDDSGIVRGVGAVTAASALHQGAVVEKLPARPKMDFAIRRGRIEFEHVVSTAGQTVMAALKCEPSSADRVLKAVTQTVLFRGGVMSVYRGHDTRERRRAQFVQ